MRFYCGLRGARRSFRDEKKQLFHRLPPEFVRCILSEFNAGNLDAPAAAAQLGIAKTRLYELRSAWLAGRDAFRSKASGGAHRGFWPDDVLAFLCENSLLARTQRLRPAPAPALLDLHLFLRQQRRANNDHTIDFDGRNYEIARTSKSSVTLIHHPQLKLWAVVHPPASIWPLILAALLCKTRPAFVPSPTCTAFSLAGASGARET